MDPNTQQDFSTPINAIAETVSKGASGIIAIPTSASPDTVAAATSLYLGLTKLGKHVTIVAAQAPQSDLVGSDKIQTAFKTSGENLMISFPYTEGAVDKVDYNIDKGFFNIIIYPADGKPKLDSSQVQYAFTGGAADFIIVLDSPNLAMLGAIYKDNQNDFQGKTIINIDRHLVNGNFGTINYVDKSSSSVSEMVLRVLGGLKCAIDKDMATNLYAGIIAATNTFSSYSVRPETFEAASVLLRFGAVRKPVRQQQAYQNMNAEQPMQQMQQPPMPVQHQQPMIQQPQPVQQPPAQPQNDQEDTPQDWLKPKIFRGGGLV